MFFSSGAIQLQVLPPPVAEGPPAVGAYPGHPQDCVSLVWFWASRISRTQACAQSESGGPLALSRGGGGQPLNAALAASETGVADDEWMYELQKMDEKDRASRPSPLLLAAHSSVG